MLQSPTEDFQKLKLDLAQSRSEMIWVSKPSKPLPKATKPGVAHTVAVGYVRMNSDNEALCSNALANIPLKTKSEHPQKENKWKHLQWIMAQYWEDFGARKTQYLLPN